MVGFHGFANSIYPLLACRFWFGSLLGVWCLRFVLVVKLFLRCPTARVRVRYQRVIALLPVQPVSSRKMLGHAVRKRAHRAPMVFALRAPVATAASLTTAWCAPRLRRLPASSRVGREVPQCSRDGTHPWDESASLGPSILPLAASSGCSDDKFHGDSPTPVHRVLVYTMERLRFHSHGHS